MSRLILICTLALGLSLAACSDDTKSGTTAPANNGEPDTGRDVGEDTDEPDTDEPDSTEDEDADEPSLCEEGQLECLDDFGQPDQSICGTTARCIMGCCVEQFSCTSDEECRERAGTDNNCPNAGLDCLCEEESGSCFTRICSNHAECEDGEICASGSCIETPEEASLQARILSAPRLLATAETGEIIAVAYDPEAPEVVIPNIALSYASSSDAVVTVADGTVTAAGMGDATITVTVTANGSDPGDTADVTVLGPAAEGVRITVVDEATLAPIEGATIVPAEGEAVTTAANGTAHLPSTNFTVLAAEHAYVSVVGASGSDLLVPLPLTVSTELDLNEDTREIIYDGLDNVDIIQGRPNFSEVTNLGELEIALNGFALGSDLLDLNFDLIIGPSVKQFLPANTPLPIPTDDPIDIPGGVTLYINSQPVVARYLLVAPPGQKTLWSLGGRISISQNPNLVPDIIAEISGDINIGQVIAIILPFFNDFYSGLEPGIQLGSEAQLPPREIDVRLRVPTARRVHITAPELPTIGGNWIDGVLFLGGAQVPGQGFVPLGVTAALDKATPDEIPDGLLDGDETRPDNQPVRLFMSPLHGGLQSERARYTIALVALSFDQLDGGKEATSVILAVSEPGASVPTEAVLPRQTFPAFREGSTWDSEARTVTLTDAEGVDMVRVVFEGNDGQKWIVWAHPGTTEITLPDLSGRGFDDFEKRRVRVVGLNLVAAQEFDELVSIQGRDLMDVVDVTTGFAILEL
jgi:hypothetical protein